MKKSDWMVKVLQIVISSEFALFKRNDSNEFALTYNFPPKTQLLGLFGAIIGLSGYSKNTAKADFYELLKGFKVAILPLNGNNESATEPPKKTVVTYNNYHGYGSMETGGILQVKEQLLIEPKYRIFILGVGGYYEKLKEKLESGEYFYTPYLGKNEFLASVQYEGEKEATKITQGDVKISGIFLKDYCKHMLSGLDGINKTHFIIVEDYPVSFDTNYIYHKKSAIYSDGIQKPDYEKIKNDGFEVCMVEDQSLFFI